MDKIRNLIYIVVIGALLVSGCMTQAPATLLPEKPPNAATPSAAKHTKITIEIFTPPGWLKPGGVLIDFLMTSVYHR